MYSTRQKEDILNYLKVHKDEQLTANNIVEHFIKEDNPIGKATIYRQLEKLKEKGEIRKYISSDRLGASFQYIGEDCVKEEHFHLKCETCGRITHTAPKTLPKTIKTIFKEYGFRVDVNKTIVYGKCGLCLDGIEEE